MGLKPDNLTEGEVSQTMPIGDYLLPDEVTYRDEIIKDGLEYTVNKRPDGKIKTITITTPESTGDDKKDNEPTILTVKFYIDTDDEKSKRYHTLMTGNVKVYCTEDTQHGNLDLIFGPVPHTNQSGMNYMCSKEDKFPVIMLMQHIEEKLGTVERSKSVGEKLMGKTLVTDHPDSILKLHCEYKIRPVHINRDKDKDVMRMLELKTTLRGVKIVINIDDISIKEIKERP